MRDAKPTALDAAIWSRYVVGLTTIIIGLGLLVGKWTLDLQQIGGALLCIAGWLIIWTIGPLKEAMWVHQNLTTSTRRSDAREGEANSTCNRGSDHTARERSGADIPNAHVEEDSQPAR